MRHHPALGLALLSVLLITSCGGGASPSPSGAGPSGSPGAAGLDGRTFLSTAVDGRALVAGSRVRLSFRNGQIGATAGCNSMSGVYHLDGNRLVVSQLATTDMGCDQALMAQDAWVADLLNGSTITLDGDDLTLAKNGVRVTFLDRKTAEPDQPLIGTKWVVDTILTGDVASSVPAGSSASLTFSDGRVDVETGCNSGGGAVAISDDTIVFEPVVMTMRACAVELMALEQAVTAALTGTATYKIEANALTLTSGGHGLRLVAPTR
jgi:heat shock protein HslJ